MYNWSDEVVFHPWVGENYEHTSPKILLLGESHYGFEGLDMQNLSKVTQDIIQFWCVENGNPGRFFTGITWTLFGDKENLGDKYSKIAFYNYVQTLMPAARVRPKKEDFISAQAPFIEVLEKLSPDYVISFGDDMTHHFPEADKEYPWKKETADEIHFVWECGFMIKHRLVRIYSLPHPSGGKFNRGIYRQYFLEKGIRLN